MRLYTVVKIDRVGREQGRIRVLAQSTQEAFIAARHVAGWSAGATLTIAERRPA